MADPLHWTKVGDDHSAHLGDLTLAVTRTAPGYTWVVYRTEGQRCPVLAQSERPCQTPEQAREAAVVAAGALP